jgi:hypothetical protein
VAAKKAPFAIEIQRVKHDCTTYRSATVEIRRKKLLLQARFGGFEEKVSLFTGV